MASTSLFGMRIEAIAAFAPQNVVTNDMIAVRLKEELEKIKAWRFEKNLPPLTKLEEKPYRTSPAWINRYIGFEERRWDNLGLGTIGMTEQAAKLLFKHTDLRPEEIDGIVFGTVTPSYLYSPPDAPLLQHRLGIPSYRKDGSPRMFVPIDVSQACSTWIIALLKAYLLIRSGLCKTVLLVGADAMSTAINFTDRAFTTVLGDAATVALCRAVPLEEDWFGLPNFWTWADGSFSQVINTPCGGSLNPLTELEQLQEYRHKLIMDGAVVREEMVPFIGGPAIKEALSRTGWTIDMFDIASLHEANLTMNTAVEELWRGIGFRGCILDAGGMFGNTTTATVPLALALNGKELLVGRKFNWDVFGGGFTAANVMGEIKHPIQTFLDV